MIEYNTKEGSEARRNNVPPTFQDEYRVIEILNSLLKSSYLADTEESEQLLQRFVNHYQNLQHHMVSSCGLYATDRKELATHPDFFQIKF